MVFWYAPARSGQGYLLTTIPAWNLGCGFAQNEAQLIAFRFLAGLGGSAPLSVRTSIVRVRRTAQPLILTRV